MLNHLTGLTADLDTAAVRAGALRLLFEVGMAVPSAAVRQRLADAGAMLRDGRIFFDEASTMAELHRIIAQADRELASP